MSITYQEAIAYSHNYATAKPDIGAAEREHILGLCQVLEAVGKERDALAAHVEQLNTRADIFFKAWDAGLLQWELETLRSAIKDAPTTSLALQKAQWQAEVLEELINQTSQYKEANPVRGLAGHMVERLHRQAEGGQSCTTSSPES